MSVTTVGDRVKIKFKQNELFGTVKFIGSVKGKSGVQYGVELDKANQGDNNGSFQKELYFVTNKKRGAFIKKTSILKTNSKKNSDAPRVTVGTKVNVPKYECNGTIKFIGPTLFKDGIWFGIQLEKSNGKNNGSVKNKQYFKCEEKFGVFVKQNGFEVMGANRFEENEDDYVDNNYGSNNNNNNNNDNNYDKQRQTQTRKDIEIIANVLNGKGTANDIDNIIKTYDDRKEDEDKEWLKIIATLKTVNDKILDLTKKQKQMQQQIQQQQQQNENKNNNNNELERRLKFEKDELKQKYESQIRTLNMDKQRLEQQVTKLQSNGNYQQPQQSQVVEKKQVDESGNGAQIEELKKEKEQLKAVVRGKEEIINNANKKIEELKKELRTLKEEEEKEELQMDSLKKDRARKLLEERVKDQQDGTMTAVQQQQEVGNKKTISEMLNDSTIEDAVNVINSMGVIKFEYDKTLKKDTYDCNLTNNSVLRRLTNDQRKQWMFLLGHCLCDKSGQKKIEKVKMSNMGIDDKVFCDFMDILIENIDEFEATEWWLESNKIGNEGMKKLSTFLGLSPKKLEVVKMYNNKTVISTPNLNDLLTNIEKNEVLQKFTFEWRLQQHRDRIAKQLKKNQDLKRKRRWANKKCLFYILLFIKNIYYFILIYIIILCCNQYTERISLKRRREKNVINYYFYGCFVFLFLVNSNIFYLVLCCYFIVLTIHFSVNTSNFNIKPQTSHFFPSNERPPIQKQCYS